MILRPLALWFRRARSLREPLSAERVFRAARATLRRKRYCLLATVDDEGAAEARVVQPAPPDPRTLRVVFRTSATSRKVRRVVARGRATLVYEDDPRQACVTLEGPARVIDDEAARRAYFPELFYAFFPAGPMQEDYVIVEVEPARVLDFARRITPHPFGLSAAVIVRRGETWQLAE